MMRRFVATTATTLALLMLLGLAGCNTMEGAGEDIEQTGEEIEEGVE